MNIEVLISCMNQKDLSIVKSSMIKTDALVINQCDVNGILEETFVDDNGNVHISRMISTTERGLSRSRNMAIANLKGDICVICDDDETYEDNYKESIINTYQENPDVDVILFRVDNFDRKFGNEQYRVNYVNALRVRSGQITFKSDSILSKNIHFDITMGSGTGNGGGEEVRFIYECLKKGLKVIYVPIKISEVRKGSPSLWFNGYNASFFENKGWASKKIMGHFFATAYVLYFAVSKQKQYAKQNSFGKAVFYLLKGVYSCR